MRFPIAKEKLFNKLCYWPLESVFEVNPAFFLSLKDDSVEAFQASGIPVGTKGLRSEGVLDIILFTVCLLIAGDL